MTSMRRRYVASTSLRRHVPAGNLAPLGPPKNSKPWPPNILNLPTPMLTVFHHFFLIILNTELNDMKLIICFRKPAVSVERISVCNVTEKNGEHGIHYLSEICRHKFVTVLFKSPY